MILNEAKTKAALDKIAKAKKLAEDK